MLSQCNIFIGWFLLTNGALAQRHERKIENHTLNIDREITILTNGTSEL